MLLSTVETTNHRNIITLEAEVMQRASTNHDGVHPFENNTTRHLFVILVAMIRGGTKLEIASQSVEFT